MPDKPPDRPTVAIPQAEIVNARLQQIIDGQVQQRDAQVLLRSEQEAGFKVLRTDIEVVANEVGVVKGRLGVAEERLNTYDEWRRASSERVKTLAGTTSSIDLVHESKLADEIVARIALASDVAGIKTDLADTKKDSADALSVATSIKTETVEQTKIMIGIATDVRSFLATPAVKIAGGVLFGFVSAYLAQHYGIVISK